MMRAVVGRRECRGSVSDDLYAHARIISESSSEAEGAIVSGREISA